MSAASFPSVPAALADVLAASQAARAAILQQIQAKQGRAQIAPDELARIEAQMEAYLKAHPSGPREPFARDADSLLARFIDQITKLSSTYERLAKPEDAPAAAARYLAQNNLSRHAVCWQTLASLDWASVGLMVEARAPRANDMVGITDSFCALAETGTLLVTTSPNTPRATTLWPETHIVLLPRARIVADFEDAFALVRAEGLNAQGGLPRALSFISGPSRTADIEQTLVLGAHGPYRVHFLIVG